MPNRMKRKRELERLGYEYVAGWLSPEQLGTSEARAVQRWIAETAEVVKKIPED